MLFMAEQYIVPILINSLESLDQMHFGRLLERILKLSVRDFIFICILLLFSFLLMCVTFSYPLDTEHVYLVAHVLQLLPSLSQFTRGGIAVRRPRILQGLVEQYHLKVHPLFPLHQLSRSHFVLHVNSSEYWRTWNLPVHNWLLRHVYYPLRRAGCSQVQCGFIIFFLSGVGHEVLVSVPCHTYQPWVLISFILQVSTSLTFISLLSFLSLFAFSSLFSCP